MFSAITSRSTEPAEQSAVRLLVPLPARERRSSLPTVHSHASAQWPRNLGCGRGERPRPAGRGEPPGSALRGGAAQPALGGRRHRAPDGRGQALPGVDPRPLLADGGGLGALGCQRPPLGAARPRAGTAAPLPRGWSLARHRPGQPLRERRLSARARRARHHLQHEPAGQRARQRGNEELALDHDLRAWGSLRDGRGRQDKTVRLRRGVLRPGAEALDAGVLEPRRVRKGALEMDPKRFAYGLAITMIFALAASRLIPHPWNCTPLIAMALFGGGKLDKPWWAVAATLASLALGDLSLGLFPYEGMAWVYGTSVLIVLIGTLLKRRTGVLTTLLATLGSGILFFGVTNFGVWAGGHLYPRTLAGLATCYVAGLPVYRNQLVGDLAYVGALFGLYWFGMAIHARYRVHPTV